MIMHHWYSSMGTGDWLAMSLFWVVVLGAIVWVVVHLAPRGQGADGDRRERPDEVLDRRLAAGEIDAATYDALRAKLHSSGQP